MATHSSVLAWKIPWAEEPDRRQFQGSQRVRHNNTTTTQHNYTAQHHTTLHNNITTTLHNTTQQHNYTTLHNSTTIQHNNMTTTLHNKQLGGFHAAVACLICLMLSQKTGRFAGGWMIWVTAFFTWLMGWQVGQGLAKLSAGTPQFPPAWSLVCFECFPVIPPCPKLHL